LTDRKSVIALYFIWSRSDAAGWGELVLLVTYWQHSILDWIQFIASSISFSSSFFYYYRRWPITLPKLLSNMNVTYCATAKRLCYLSIHGLIMSLNWISLIKKCFSQAKLKFIHKNTLNTFKNKDKHFIFSFAKNTISK
jgi:hypothetical protein